MGGQINANLRKFQPVIPNLARTYRGRYPAPP